MRQIHISVAEAFANAVDADKLKAAALAALEHQNAPQNAEMSLIITDDAEVRALNARYRGVDAPTDVLSFADGTPIPETGSVYLGDVVISYPAAKTQAANGGHPVDWELCLLTVHGVLHLLGHDHAEASEKERMWSAQSEILRSLGCPLSPP